MTRRSFKQTLAAVVFAVSALVCSALPASAATGVDGFQIAVAGSTGGQVHHCTVVGSSGIYQAVVCVDISTSITNTTTRDYEATGAIEVYCQTSSGATLACDSVDIEGVFANGAGSNQDSGWWGCGGSLTPCPSGRKIITEGRINYSGTSWPTCQNSPGSVYAVWTVIYGGSVLISLPVSGKNVTLGSGSANDGSNYSTGHYYVCPYLPQ